MWPKAVESLLVNTGILHSACVQQEVHQCTTLWIPKDVPTAEVSVCYGASQRGKNLPK